jgi:hypothetical protein
MNNNDTPAYTIIGNTVYGATVNPEIEKEFDGWDAERRRLFASEILAYVNHLNETAAALEANQPSYVE